MERRREEVATYLAANSGQRFLLGPAANRKLSTENIDDDPAYFYEMLADYMFSLKHKTNLRTDPETRLEVPDYVRAGTMSKFRTAIFNLWQEGPRNPPDELVKKLKILLSGRKKQEQKAKEAGKITSSASVADARTTPRSFVLN